MGKKAYDQIKNKCKCKTFRISQRCSVSCKNTRRNFSLSQEGQVVCNMTSLPDALSVLGASQIWTSMNWKPYSLWYSFISLQVRTETCIVTSQAVICFVTEKRILFSKIISWAPLQATKKKQSPIIQPNLLIKGTAKVEQKPDSSAMVSFEAGMGNLWEFDANSEHLFTVQHHLKQWGRGGAAEAVLLQPCP